MRRRISRTACVPSSIGGIGFISQKFEWRDEGGNEKAKKRVDDSDVIELVGVGKVEAIPCDEKIAPMVRRQGQVKCIACRIRRHDCARDIGAHDVRYRGLNRKERERFEEREAIRPGWEVATREFLEHGRTREEFIPLAGNRPPGAGPRLARDHLRVGSEVEVETRYGGLDVHALTHSLGALSGSRSTEFYYMGGIQSVMALAVGAKKA